MSGGSLNYFNCKEPIVNLKKEIIFGKNRYSEEVLEFLRTTVHKLREGEIYSHRAEWLLSGDDDEDDFCERLKEDLVELEREPAIPCVVPKCEYCEHCGKERCENSFGIESYKKYKANKDDASKCYGFCPSEEAILKLEYPEGEYEA